MTLFDSSNSNNSALNLVVYQIPLHEVLVAKLITTSFTHFHAIVKLVHVYKQRLMMRGKGPDPLLAYIGASF